LARRRFLLVRRFIRNRFPLRLRLP
jgi:hypothetical protein